VHVCGLVVLDRMCDVLHSNSRVRERRELIVGKRTYLLLTANTF
jgi:hypothetical protein